MVGMAAAKSPALLLAEPGCFETGTESNPASPRFPPGHCYSTVPP